MPGTYQPWVSEDGTVMVQMFVNEDGVPQEVAIATRGSSSGTWGPPTEVFREARQ